ncbi:2OG-Fe(II) oxygenase [Dokdonella immobilis]|uniref:2OG-Fe(II) oxygenase superfamily protein n=1 Tax=Dokdonella immobilis TaxID=578942 RepID=A0A1I4XF23_9GAMM|nr:2OG-Fe(II) oxygenase [Dokdonella immobilis]SFN24073.1 2OG-Fe(II) oxygenase superfamily protein [Dokdonella immobilis]
MNVIDPRVHQKWEDAAQQFANAEPFRFVVIEDFLDCDLCHALSTDFPSFEERNALNEMGQVGGKAVRTDVRDISEAYRELDRYIQTSAFLDYVSRVTGIPGLLYDPDYIGGGTHENRHGQGLDAHVDFNYHPRTKWHRRLNLIIYLNEEWRADWGGQLELHSNPWDRSDNRTRSVAPLMNTCVIFETNEVSWHGFSKIELPESRRQLSRRSFAIYLYTRERPAAETAPPHATIYVPEDTLDWKPGRELDEADIRELRNRFVRMRTQLRFLYDREKQFGAQIASLEHALSEARDSMRLPVQGYAVQPRGVTGLWPDGWVGEAMSAALQLTRKASSLVIEVWVPPQLGADQELRITIAGEKYTQNLSPGARTSFTLPLKVDKGNHIELEILASRTWIPAKPGEPGDQRVLAFKILSAHLQ